MICDNLLTMLLSYRNKRFSGALHKVYPDAEVFTYCWTDFPPVYGNCTLFVKLQDSYLRVSTVTFCGLVFITKTSPLEQHVYEKWLNDMHVTIKPFVTALG